MLIFSLKIFEVFALQYVVPHILGGGGGGGGVGGGPKKNVLGV